MSNWEQIQDVFRMTVDLPIGEQQCLLDSLCAHDPELRAEVESLLEADIDRGRFIANIVQSEASLVFDLNPLQGKRLGAYRIVREIGRGGMGAVYLATRDDEAYQKQVAVKVVKPGMDTGEVLNRFRYERQILAGLEHPYIARLFDAGSTDEGLPYFVMEYVEGQPVDAFCRSNHLNNHERCKIFLKILEAVSYAHRNLVVHRDLKPGNIFVTPESTPKLLDFGVAKLISGSGAGQTLLTLQRPFTPEYASPEQVLGLVVTTSTDIYSLGAVFYELLTDRRAQPIGTPTPAEIERAVCVIEPACPSQLAPSVDADLDNIVLMAMRKEPERRYHSVDQFAEDIQRYLDGRPVLARQDSVIYRFRKFVSRNRLQLATVTIVILTLSAGLVVSLLQTRRAGEALQLAKAQRLLALHENARAIAAERTSEVSLISEAKQRAIADHQAIVAEQQRDIAQDARSIAERRLTDIVDLADRTLFDVHDAVAKLPGSMAARKQIVKTTLDYLERLEKEANADDNMRLALASAYLKISLIQGTFGAASQQNYAGAEASLLKGQAIILPLYRRKSGEPQVMTRRIQIQEALADLDYQAGKDSDAIKIDLELLPVARRLARATPNDRAAVRQEPELEGRLANSYLRISSPHSLEHADRGAFLLRQMTLRNPDDSDSKEDLATLLTAAAVDLQSKGELNEAALDFQQSLQVREDLLRSQPSDTRNRRNLIVDYAQYALLLANPESFNLGKPAEARIYTAKAVALSREVANSDPQDLTARYDLGMALGMNGMIDPPPDGASASLASLEEAASLIAPIAQANPTSATNAYQLANILEDEGNRLRVLGRGADAEQKYRESLDILQPFLSMNISSVTSGAIAVEEDLALLLSETGDHGSALEHANRAVTHAEERTKSSPSSQRSSAGLANAYATVAQVQEKAADLGHAQQNARHALEIWKHITSPSVLSFNAGHIADTETLLVRLSASTPKK